MKSSITRAGIAAATGALLLLSTACTSTPTPAQKALTPETTDEFVPSWAKNVVWYQVFPERFNNGDPSNDPKLEDLTGAWPTAPDKPWDISPWTSDWYELQPWEWATGENIWWNILRRRCGGDLQGIIDKLDYLQDLGVTAIYLNPIFMSPSLHKYDGESYHHVEPIFGPDPAGDEALIATENPADPSTWVMTSADNLALELINEVHKRGMRIIFDGVFNHLGYNSWPFQDVVKNQQDSPYKDWFVVHSWRDEEAGTEFKYQGWFGVDTLPELREDENGIVDGPKQYIFDSTSRWMDPNGDGDPSDGIDGWRLDVAFCVDHAFWKDWRKHVKAINPEAYLTAEIVDPIPKVKPYLQGDEFDAVMNYNFAFTSAEFFIEEEHSITPSEFDAKLRDLRNAFGGGVASVQQNLFDSHDTNRIGSHIVNRAHGHYRDWGSYFNNSKAENNRNYNTRKPSDADRQIQKLFVIFQMTYPGAPMVYYGDEAGMWGGNDPDCRKPMVWPELTYQRETTLPTGAKFSPGDVVAYDHDMASHYRKMIRIRNNHPALRTGDFETVLTDDEAEVYAYRRIAPRENILVVLNNSDQPRAVSLPVGRGQVFTDLLNGGLLAAEGTTLTVNIPARWGAVLNLEK
ncbi:glycoside hydrolase family 13 protein [bacterium]|nr:glycoside hydrolase family 13 protein [bacterium]